MNLATLNAIRSLRSALPVVGKLALDGPEYADGSRAARKT